MRLNIDRSRWQLPNKSRHLNELTHEPAIRSWDTSHWLSCFDSCQLTILWMSNVKDVDFVRHPSLPFDSLPYPTRTIRRGVRTYVRSVNHVTTKRKEVDHNLWVWGSVSRARSARGSPAINRAMHLCNPRFSWREIAQEMAWPTSSRSKTCLF